MDATPTNPCVRRGSRSQRPRRVFGPAWAWLACWIVGCAGARPEPLTLVEAPPHSVSTWSTRARATFEAGLSAAQLAQWDEAIHQLRASLRIESHVETLIDLAYAERSTGHYRTALAVLDSLLAMPDVPDASRVRAAMDDARRHTGVLVLRVTPDDARIEVDGTRVVGRNEVTVDEGRHVVTADAPGFEPMSDDVVVPGGMHRLVEMPLVARGRRAEGGAGH